MNRMEPFNHLSGWMKLTAPVSTKSFMSIPATLRLMMGSRIFSLINGVIVMLQNGIVLDITFPAALEAAMA